MDYEYQNFINEKAAEYLLAMGFIRIGRKLKGRCPFCGDSHKSKTKARGWYYDDTCSYYCFNCGQSLPGIKLLELISGQAYYDIKKEYVRLFLKSGLDSGLSARFDTPVSVSLFDFKPMTRPEWKHALSDKAKVYLDSRMVTSAPFLKEDLYSYFSKTGEEFIFIPWIVNGVEAYYQLNDFQKLHSLKYVFPKDTHKLVYGLDEIDMSWPYIIVFEGVYDSLFVKNAVAVGTKSLSQSQERLIRTRYPNHQICFSFDNDLPGISSTVKALESERNVKFFKWFNKNTEAKDVNDYVLKIGRTDAFVNPKVLERMIFSPMQMKAWLIENGMWRKENRPRRSTENAKYVHKPDIDLKSKFAFLK